MRLTKSDSRKTMKRTAVKMVRIEQHRGKVSVSVVVGLLMLAMGVVIGTRITRTSTEMKSNTPTAATKLRDDDVIRVVGRQAVPSLVDESSSVMSENDSLWRRQPRPSNREEEHKLADFLSTPPSEEPIRQQQEQEVDVAALRSNIVAKQPQAVQPVHHNTEIKATFAERRTPKVQRDTPEELFAKSSACVVRVNIRNAQNKVVGHGSGFFVRDDSTVVTNFHVIDGANSAEVVLQDNTLLPVLGVQGFDAASDVAILKVARRTKRKVSHLSLELNLPPVGREVYVIGAPQGLDFTLSDGLVSGHREIDGHTWIQVTAPISAGSSGSPVLNEDGLVIGIASMSRAEGQNLNFAAPAAAVNSLLIGNATLQRLVDLPSTKQRTLASIRAVTEKQRVLDSIEEIVDKRTDQASKTASKMLDQLPDSYREVATYWILRGDIAYQQNQFEAAIAACQMALTIDDADPQIWYRNSQIWYRIGLAHARLANLTNVNPDRKDEKREKDQYEKAVQAYRAGIDLAPEDHRCWFELGRSFIALKRPEEAVVALRRCLMIKPGDWTIHESLGNALAEMGDFESGLAEFKIALDMEPNQCILIMDYGNFLRRGGRFKEATRFLEKGLSLATAWPPKWLSGYKKYLQMARSLDDSPAFPLGQEAE